MLKDTLVFKENYVYLEKHNFQNQEQAKTFTFEHLLWRYFYGYYFNIYIFLNSWCLYISVILFCFHA